jgi:hypothetical protein
MAYEIRDRRLQLFLAGGILGRRLSKKRGQQ